VSEARALLGPGALLSAAVHDVAGVERRAGASLLVAAPFGPVAGKGAPLGIQGIEALVRRAKGPVCALGGITAAEVPALRRAGVAGIGTIRGWLGEDGGAGAATLYAAWMGGGT
jgi:thiamine-phosphate pyrophosphorylase